MKPLPQDFYIRDALDVARDLLGAVIVRGPVALRITEVEAYRWPDDTANHCRFGKTARNAPMWAAGGHAYVYLCYGMHNMLNLVTGREGEGAAVLIRSCEPVNGLALIRRRRSGLDGPPLLTGPGKIGQALALTTRHSGLPLFDTACTTWGDGAFDKDALVVCDGTPPHSVLAGPRVGIDYASDRDRKAPWRLAVAGTKWVSQPRGLRPSKD